MTKPTYNFIAMGPRESIADRPFTHIRHTSADLQALTHIAGRLGEVASTPVSALPFILETTDPNGRYLRIVLCQPDKLNTNDTLFVVGFFGQRRSTAELGPLSQVDETLVKGLAEYPYVISYSSLQLEDGNYGNLVVLSEASGRESWRESTTHQYAVAELSPGYYESVRLHNGVMRGMMSQQPQITLTNTKYFDYRDGFWCGLREIAE